MWEVMFECHSLQYQIILNTYTNGNSKISIQSESHRQFTIHLENELSSLSSSFAKWIGAQKSYLQAINGWLFKCVSVQEQSSRRKRRRNPPQLRYSGPPIYVTCGNWLDMLDRLPTKEVTDSIKVLASETDSFLPRQEKSQDKKKGMNHPHLTDPDLNILRRDEAPAVDYVVGFERFRSGLVGFLFQLNNFAELSVKEYGDLEKAIKDHKPIYEQIILSQVNNNNVV